MKVDSMLIDLLPYLSLRVIAKQSHQTQKIASGLSPLAMGIIL